jgi:hypothetical protein
VVRDKELKLEDGFMTGFRRNKKIKVYFPLCVEGGGERT